MYDIAIIGLGPAGATLARTLDPAYKVLVVDRKDFSAATGKCCGGLLATDAQKSLAKFGLTLPREILVDPQIFAVRTIDLHQPVERYYQRFYLNMDRHRFDCWLLSLIGGQVTVLDDAFCNSIQREEDVFSFQVTRKGEAKNYVAKVIVGADGGGSVVRRQVYPHKSIRQYVSIQEWYEETQMEPFYASIFDPDVTDCYSWTIHKDGLMVVGSALPKDEPNRRFELLKQRLEGRGYRFGNRVRREGCFVYRPTGFGSFVTGSGGAYLIGEAAGFISPSSLEGMSYAMDSGYLLACALNGGLEGAGQRYAQASVPIRCKLVGKQLKNPFMYHPLLRRMVMSSGLASIDMA